MVVDQIGDDGLLQGRGEREREREREIETEREEGRRMLFN